MHKIAAAIWKHLKQWPRKPDGQLILLVLFFYCCYRIHEDYQKSLLEPGNDVIYHGKYYEIEQLTEDPSAHKTTIRLMNSTKDISADSVTIAHQPFWHGWL